MIRGVNRQIIEINDTQNNYFEKAILFVRADCSDCSQHSLKSEALKFIEQSSGVACKSSKRKKHLLSRRALWLLLLTVSTAAAIMAIKLIAG